ncbi:MAG: hypothetical protein IJ812_10525 [Schwartzia sp.]|nr:hypothetical protein [Schwartzia sp. (in: firmicutes)]MBR1886828.1 hypothetical protein [Schwartzia sp. (in: firmicutes)]
MAIVRKFIRFDQPLTQEQLKELEEMDKAPIVYDEDCPPLTDEELEKVAAIVRKRNAARAKANEPVLEPLAPLYVLPDTMRTAEKYGTRVMARLLDLAVQDETMIQKCL